MTAFRQAIGLRVLALCGAIALSACGQSDSSSPGDSVATDSAAVPTPQVPPVAPVDLLPVGHGDLLAPPPAANAGIRTRRRMDIDQLNASIRQVSGGLYWSEMRGSERVDLFEDLAGTLGRPDFIQQTSEDLEVSLLFQKFLGDAARDVCGRLAEAERETAAEERVLLVHVEPSDTYDSATAAVEDNLSALVLRYHGQSAPPGSETLNRWRWLFQSTLHVAEDPVHAWRAVCVGLMTHPDFYSY